MEKHLLRQMKQKIASIGGFVTQIEKHAQLVETMWERYHDPRRQDALVNPARFVRNCEEFKQNNIEPVRREISDLFSYPLRRVFESYLNSVLQLLNAIEQEYSKGFNQIRGSEGQAYVVSSEHVLQKTRGIRNELAGINKILEKYIE